LHPLWRAPLRGVPMNTNASRACAIGETPSVEAVNTQSAGVVRRDEE
jgi:hypothetical protein